MLQSKQKLVQNSRVLDFTTPERICPRCFSACRWQSAQMHVSIANLMTPLCSISSCDTLQCATRKCLRIFSPQYSLLSTIILFLSAVDGSNEAAVIVLLTIRPPSDELLYQLSSAIVSTIYLKEYAHLIWSWRIRGFRPENSILGPNFFQIWGKSKCTDLRRLEFETSSELQKLIFSCLLSVVLFLPLSFKTELVKRIQVYFLVKFLA